MEEFYTNYDEMVKALYSNNEENLYNKVNEALGSLIKIFYENYNIKGSTSEIYNTILIAKLLKRRALNNKLIFEGKRKARLLENHLNVLSEIGCTYVQNLKK